MFLTEITPGPTDGVWVNARGKAASAKFPNASAGPTVGCTVVGNSLLDNAPAGVRSDNVSDETLVGNSIVNSDGAAGVLMVGGNARVAVVGNTISSGTVDRVDPADHQPSKPLSLFGVLIQPAAPVSDKAHTYVPATGVGLVDICVRANVSLDAMAATASKNGGMTVAGNHKVTPPDDFVYAP